MPNVSDTVFFLLPAKDSIKETIYGVSCYRQVSTKELLRKDDDVTRSTVQKSVCVLSMIPLFGSLKAKLELITQAYFNERNFAKVEVLAEMYQNLSATVTHDMIKSQALLGLSARQQIRRFKNKLLILFKLVLLEKRVLFYLFPVNELCHSILTLVSLFPDGIEKGLSEASVYIPQNRSDPISQVHTQLNTDAPHFNDEERDGTPQCPDQNCPAQEADTSANSDGKDPEDSLLDEIAAELSKTAEEEEKGSSVPPTPTTPAERIFGTVSHIGQRLSDYWSGGGPGERGEAEGGGEKEAIEVGDDAQDLIKHSSTLDTDSWGFPLSIFTKGNLCHPYLSLAYLDYLKSNRVRAYIFGATNALYRQRKDLLDAIVFEDETGEIQVDILDNELKKQLQLMTPDLRFLENILKKVPDDTGNVFLDATSWDGNEECIRHHFRSYLLSLIVTAKCRDPTLWKDFNESFVDAWKTTHNFRVWSSGHYPDLENLLPGHLFPGQTGIGDVGLRLQHSVQSNKQVRKIAKVSNALTSKLAGFFWTDVPGAPERPISKSPESADHSASERNDDTH